VIKSLNKSKAKLRDSGFLHLGGGSSFEEGCTILKVENFQYF